VTGERWRLIEDLFTQALERPASDRQAFLDQVCQGDQDLRRELESLLECDAPDQRLVDVPEMQDEDMAGRRIGPYRIIRLIGRGGMGAVYLGVRDDDQYQKQVAIKLLNRGMDTDFMLSRFRQERQILANLEHPFIARLIDGGATQDGLPYFVMEYVDGVPITTFCSDKRLTIAERLRLFRLVCEAVQYAHQNLVVHRDIKPSNILTTKEGIPKLLDFGIAKVLQPGAPAGATLTRRELRMLTPDYASPEQVKGLQISTASDTYSLGAVLYELLTGTRPHQFASEAITDVERTICAVEPQKPSLAANSDSRRRLAGDLDNIVLTAMRKEPGRRYASAAEFSEDLRRHMEGLPVLAREDLWTYRAGKFVRRNRLAVGAALLVAASLVIGIVTTTIEARRGERRFRLARQMAKAVVDQVKGPLRQLPGSTPVRATMVQTMLQYLDGLAQDPGNDPEFQLEIAQAYWTVGAVEGHPYQQNLGQTAAALSHYEKAIAIYASLTGRPDTRVRAFGGLVGTNMEIGSIEARIGRVEAATARVQRMVALATEIASRDATAVGPGTWAYLYFRLTDQEVRKGAYELAVVNARKSVEVCRQWVATDQGSNARGTLRGAYSILAGVQLVAGDIMGARENYEMALKIAAEAVLQPNTNIYERSTLSGAYENLGNLLGNPYELNLGEFPAAVSRVSSAIGILEAMAAEDRHDVRARDDLSSAYNSLGAILLEPEPSKALQAYQKARTLAEELTAGEPSNAKYRKNFAAGQMGIGEALHRLGRNPEALQSLTHAREMMEALEKSASGVDSGADEIRTMCAISRVHRDIADVLLAIGDEKGALQGYRDALASSEKFLRRDPASVYYQRSRADSMESLGRYYATLARRRPELKAEARSCLEKSLATWQDWKRRNIAAPYSGVREKQTVVLIAGLAKN